MLTDTIDRLAAFEPVPFPVLSLYLDARAGATGRDQFEPFLRKAFRDRLHTYAPHSPGHASFSADIERINRFLANELQPSTNGVAVFACAGADGFFETLQLDAPFDEHRLYVDDVPHLYPLARVDDQHPRYAAVVADTNFARIFVFGTGRIVREDAIAGVKTKHVRAGGWSQARYQRRVGEYRQQHVKEIADTLDRIMRAEGIDRLVIGGDEVFESFVRSEFPPHLLERVVDTVRLDISAHEREVLTATLEALRQHDATTDAQIVERLFEAVRGSGLGVLGADDTLAALKLGQVDELVITATPDTLTNVDHLVPAGVVPPPTHPGSAAQGLAAVDAAAAALADQPEAAADAVPAHEKVANQLVTLARQTSAAVRFIEDPALLAEVGGVGAFLRFRVQEN